MPEIESGPPKESSREQAAEIDRLIEEQTQAIHADPNNALSYRARGLQYGRRSYYAQAIQDFDKALELAPDDARSLGLRGIALLRTGEHQRAIEDFDRAAQLDPEHAELYIRHKDAALAELKSGDKVEEGEERDFGYSHDLAFNLLKNPFVVLGVEPTATVQAIKYALEDAVDDQVAPIQELERAQQILLTPKLRLDAELSGLPDVPPATVTDIIARLKRGFASESLASLTANLHSLPRTNVLSHVGASSPLTVDQMIELLDAQTAIAVGAVTEAINDSREEAGIAKVDRDAVGTALEKLEQRKIKAVVERLVDNTNSIASFGEFLSRVLNEASSTKVSLLDRYVHAYGLAVAPELSRRRDKVVEACGVIRSQPASSAAVESLSKALQAWNEIGRPLQSFEFHMSREEPQAKELYNTVRDLYLWLANEKSGYQTAKQIAKACADVFDLLPRSIEQMRKDEEKLGELLNEQKAMVLLGPLIAICEKAGNDHRGLEKALLRDGFGPASRGAAQPLYTEFCNAALATEGTEFSDAPWRMVRDIAISLNNDSQSPQAAQAIIAGLIRYLSSVRPSESVAETLKADERAAQKNIVQKEMDAHVRAGRLTPAIQSIDRLLSFEAEPSDLADLRKLRDILLSKRRSRNLARWGWAAAAVFVIFLIAANQDKNPTYSAAPTSYTPKPTAAAPNSVPQQPYVPNSEKRSTPPATIPTTPPVNSSARIEKPPEGTTLVLTQANIRYCEYYKVILDTVRSATPTKSLELAFNDTVADWNSRCSQYRYYPQDKQIVDAEIPAKHAELEKKGRSFIEKWASPPEFKKSGLAIDTSDGPQRFTVDLAVTPKEWSWGTSFRSSMPSNSGVLYIYPAEKTLNNTMATAYFSLDVLFIDKNRRISQIFQRRQPKSTDVITSKEPGIAMLELNGGAVARLGIKVGDLLHTFKLPDNTSSTR